MRTEELTAGDIWELVKGWPGEARPRYLEFIGRSWYDDGKYLGTHHAAALHVASGLEWLAGRSRIAPVLWDMGESSWAATHHDERWKIDNAWGDDFEELASGPTLLHAVSAAVMAVA